MGNVNGLPAHILLVHAIVILLPLAAVLLMLTNGRIAGIYITRNPDKLRRVAEAVAMPAAR